MNQKLSLSKEKIHIVLLEGVHQRAVEVFRRNGYENISYFKTALPETQLRESLATAHMVGIRSRTQLTDQVIAEAPKLMAIGCFCIGTNQVDLDGASLAGIPVFNAPHSNTRSVAELVIAQTVMLMRGIFAKSTEAHRHRWRKSAANSHEVRGKTLGIVGYGHIGSQASILAEAMGMRVLYYDVQSKLPLGNAKSVDSLAELLAASDVVTLHVPENKSTRGMIGRDQIALMKKGASYLINASRGTVVDIDALAKALDDGDLMGAAIDVFPVEPKSNEDRFESPLIGLDNVILTPHIGGSTKEAQQNIGHQVAARLAIFSDRGVTEGAVNFPQVNMAANVNTHRLLHIHHNVPGVLRQINRIVADEDINVTGQYLATDEKIGYVVLDMASGASDKAVNAMKAIEGTIRTRLLY